LYNHRLIHYKNNALLKIHNQSNKKSDKNLELTIKTLAFNSELTSSKIFSHFSDLPWSTWLDSCNSEHIDSRFDIMVWDPTVTLSTSSSCDKRSPKDKIHSKTTITNKLENIITTSLEDPLALLNQHLEEVFSNINISSAIDCPFKGGAVGYFAYDLGREFEVLPTFNKTDINLPNMAIGIYTKAIVFDNQTQLYSLL